MGHIDLFDNSSCSIGPSTKNVPTLKKSYETSIKTVNLNI